MKKDIDFPKVEGVRMAISRQKNEVSGEYEFHVYLINENDFTLENVLINSSGYSKKKEQKTSVLRHYLDSVAPNSVAKVELINPELFAFVNQFWVSYYIEKKVYDKKFIFMPESVTDENFQYIASLEMEGVLHA
ncbi:hypothetical protein [Tunicatimonas pelagia]|uniref:hypothetical protein n=1 Tax=Tunicatimonas pelagia TaxID=931531 RepID=UPI002665B5FE|nr:hypothetical protein [Tunicatimonas pelagia]WKN45564.1 hypothetical protein P0M28_11415 [Tunicatimonas pelagia]